MRPNRAFCTNSSAFLASRSTSSSGSPEARQFVIRSSAAVGRISEVAGLLRRLEGAPQEDAAGRQVLRPVCDMDGEDQVDAGAEAVEPALLDQIQAKSAETVSCLVVSEVRPEDATQPHIGEA